MQFELQNGEKCMKLVGSQTKDLGNELADFLIYFHAYNTWLRSHSGSATLLNDAAFHQETASIQDYRFAVNALPLFQLCQLYHPVYGSPHSKVHSTFV